MSLTLHGIVEIVQIHPIMLLPFFEIDVGRPKPPARRLRLRSDRQTPENRLAGSNLGPNLSMPQRPPRFRPDLPTPEAVIAARGLLKMGQLTRRAVHFHGRSSRPIQLQRKAATRSTFSAITRALSCAAEPAGAPPIKTSGLDHTGKRGQPPQFAL